MVAMKAAQSDCVLGYAMVELLDASTAVLMAE
jgi:hypothetical protein